MALVKHLMLMLAWLSGTSACFCVAGEYCDSGTQTCLPCSAGTFNSENKHSDKYCKKWSTKPPGPHVVIIQNGSRTRDILYGCESGYERHDISAGGEWECRKATTTTSTTSSTSKSTSTTTQPLPEITVETGKMSKEFETTPIVVIVVICLGVVAGVVAVRAVVIYKKWKKKKRNDAYRAVIDPLFAAVVNVLGEEERRPFIDVLDNPGGTFDTHQNSDFKTLLHSWASCYPGSNHSQCIVRALDQKGYKLPEVLDETDLAVVTGSLIKAGQLNHEFKIFCSKLFEEMDTEKANELVTELEIKSDFDNRMLSNSNRLDIALPLCLAKWAFKFPYVHNQNRDWLALTQLKENLVKIERNDLAQKFEEMANNVYDIMETFSPIQNGAALQNGAAFEEIPLIQRQMS